MIFKKDKYFAGAIQSNKLGSSGRYSDEYSFDISFLLDCATAILMCLADSSVSVRIKAAWSLGNVSDTISNNKDRGLADFVAEFPASFLTQLLQAGTAGTNDSEKVKYNAVRAVGNLLRYVSCTDIVSMEKSGILRDSVTAITKCVNCGSMKVRWNACYSISSILKNTSLLPYIDKENLMAMIIDALMLATRDSKNFKVRLGASEALMAPGSRTGYGPPHQFALIWLALIDGLETSELINDFSEFRYKDSLLNQVCETLFHLVSLAGVGDLTPLSHLSLIKWHSLYDYVDKWGRMKSAKEGLIKVESNLAQLACESLDARQQEGLQCIQNLYLIYTKEHEACAASLEKTSFVQTYD